MPPAQAWLTLLSTGHENQRQPGSSCCRPMWPHWVMAVCSPPGFSVDWWALGVLMFEMMAGRSPFDIITDNPDMNTEDYLFQGACPAVRSYPSPARLSSFSKVQVEGSRGGLERQCHAKRTGNHSSWPDPVSHATPRAVGWGYHTCGSAGTRTCPHSAPTPSCPGQQHMLEPQHVLDRGCTELKAQPPPPKPTATIMGSFPPGGPGTCSWSGSQCCGDLGTRLSPRCPLVASLQRRPCTCDLGAEEGELLVHVRSYGTCQRM